MHVYWCACTYFSGKTILITGGAGGIGRASARRFLEEGANVVLSGRRDKLEAAQAELDPSGERCDPPRRDRHARAGAGLVAAAVERFGGVDMLVNSTGIFRRSRSSSRPRSTSRRR